MRGIWRKSFRPLLPFLLAVWMVGCGAEGPAPPAAGRAVIREIDRKGERQGSMPGPSAFFKTGPKDEPDDPKVRLEEINRTVQEGNPETLEVLYGALADPDPEIQKEVAEWLEVLVEYDPEVRPRLEALQKKESNAIRWHRLAGVLAEPEPEWADMMEEETSESERES